MKHTLYIGRRMAMTLPEVHVMPQHDLRDHETSRECWCKPTEDEDEPRVVLHHAMDQREQYEQGRKPQ